MKTKVLEIRDANTCIPALAIQMLSLDRVRYYYIHGRSGYPNDGSSIVLMKLSDQKASSDPYGWNSRTMIVAHSWIIANFADLNDGDVVDVQYILNETAEPKHSERFETVGL